jgi:uncharacterized membrane-anchored protein YjiN (DUF445 family)
MNQDVVIFHHKELCNEEKYDEARMFAMDNNLKPNWNYISLLVMKELFEDCFSYIQGFYNPHLAVHEENEAPLHETFVILKNFLCCQRSQEISLDLEIRKLLCPQISFLSNKFQTLAHQQEVTHRTQKKNKKPSNEIVNKNKFVFLDNLNKTPLKKRHSEKDVQDLFLSSPQKKRKQSFETVFDSTSSSTHSDQSEMIEERILEVFEKLEQPASWKVLKELVPGDKKEIWNKLNKLVQENIIEEKEEHQKRKSNRIFELSPQEVFE